MKNQFDIHSGIAVLTKRCISEFDMSCHAFTDLGNGRAAPSIAGELPQTSPNARNIEEWAENEGLSGRRLLAVV